MLNIFVVVVVCCCCCCCWLDFVKQCVHCRTIALCSDACVHVHDRRFPWHHMKSSQCVYTSFFLHLHSLRYQIIIRVLHHWFCFISLISTISMLFFSKVHCPHNCFCHCLCWKIRVLSFTYDATLILSTVYRDSQ